MKKKKYLLLIIFPFLINTNHAFASCTNEEIDQFKKVESSYKITYEFDKENQYYNLLLTSSPSEYKNFNYKIYSSNILKCITDENKILCSQVPEGDYTFKIIGLSDTCNDTLKTINFKLDKYNPYSEDPLCEGYEEFYLCQTTYDKEIDYETFVSRINTYRKNHSKKEQIIEDENKENKISKYTNKAIDYIKNNLLSIIVVVVFIGLVLTTIIVTIKSSRKSRRLE